MKIRKIALFFLPLLFAATTGFADNLFLVNKTSYPAQNQTSKMAIQWASSAKEVDANNKAVMHGEKLNSDTMQIVNQSGKIKVDIPKNAEYFRVLVWSKGGEDPDFLTNWVDVVSNKTYTVEKDHLVPAVLMPGTGC